ncbi:centromere protein J-like [Stylophora pistillata]|uniref:centromere protein J-like n=1 Tax=Stylophora pistillata TaxID=50429 RepID=UPI000C039F7B|nr:centromere protein J-like [Stylophora pistillata]
MESLKAIADDNSQKENNPFLTTYIKERSLQREVPLSNVDPNFATDQEAKSQQPLKVRNMTTQAQNHRPHDQAQLVDKFRKLRQWQQQQQESMFRQQQQQMETLRMEQNKLQSILAAQRKLQGQTATSTSMYPPNSGTVLSQSQSVAERSLAVTSQLQQGSVRVQAPLDRGSRVQFEDGGFEPVRNNSNAFLRSTPTSSEPSHAMDQIALEMQTRQLGSQQFGESEPKFSANEKDRLRASLPHLNETVYPVMWNSSNYRFPLGAIPPVAGSRMTPIPEQPTTGSAMASNPVTHPGMTEIPQHFQSPVIGQRPGDMFQNNPATNSGDCPELNLERIDTAQYGRNSAMTPELERLWSHNAGVEGMADADSQEDERSEADTLSGVYPLYDSEPDMGFNEIEDENEEEAVNVESDVEEELEESYERDRTVIDLLAQSQDSEEANEQHMKENCQTEVGDEIPIKPGIGGSSRAKTFEELLEEQLKLDAEASERATKAQSTTHKPQRTFLRKGQGLARFKGKSASAKVVMKTKEPAVHLTTLQQKKGKKTGNPVTASSQVANKSGGVSGGPVAQSKVTRKVASRSPQVMTEASGSTTSVKPQQIRGSKPLKTQAPSSDGQPASLTVTRPAVMPTSVASNGPEERDPHSVCNSIDASFQMRLKELEEKQELEEEELEEFELLEQAAANASFSSNSSVVVKVLAKARGGSALISKNNAKEGTVNKPENKGAGGILSPVDTGYGSGDCKVTLSDDGPEQPPVGSQVRELRDNESVDGDSDVTLQEISLDSALELDCGQNERIKAAGDQRRVLAPVYVNPPSTESDDEFNDADTWAAIKKQAGTNIEKMEKKVEVDSGDDDDDDADDSDVTISDIFPLVTSTPPVPRKVGQPQNSKGTEVMDDEVLAASTPPTSALVTKLFPQLKPKQKAAQAVSKQATTDASKNPSDKGNTEEHIDTVQSIAVREKLKELETEIDKFRTENAALAKIRREREEGLKKLQKEIAAFEKQKTEELERLEQFREEEMRKLRRERRVFEKYQKAARSMPDKKEREEIESLREQVTELQEELKRRESRWSAASTRSRQKIEALEEQNKELEEEVKLLEHYRLQQWREDEQAKAKEEEQSRPKKPLLRKTAKTMEEEILSEKSSVELKSLSHNTTGLASKLLELKSSNLRPLFL